MTRKGKAIKIAAILGEDLFYSAKRNKAIRLYSSFDGLLKLMMSLNTGWEFALKMYEVFGKRCCCIKISIINVGFERTCFCQISSVVDNLQDVVLFYHDNKDKRDD